MDCRIFVEKKPKYQTEAKAMLEEIRINLHEDIESLRKINIYDLFDITPELLKKAINTIFSDCVTDTVYGNFDVSGLCYFAYEPIPGQYDQRADSAKQLLNVIEPGCSTEVRSGTLIVIEAKNCNLSKIKNYYINRLELREKNLSVLESPQDAAPEEMPILTGFFETSSDTLIKNMELSLSVADLECIKDYFRKQHRLPTETEIRVLDTYWSDHCRHTTFLTSLDISIEDSDILKAYKNYLDMKKDLNREAHPITLMDLATVNMRYESKHNHLDDLEQSEEKNACSIIVDVNIDDKKVPYLIMFKNETHNHPTEIEPFGGASTCIGGAIRDPLSGRSYVYQAMRVTGSGDIRAEYADTRPGKLPQRLISKKAALGYSSYGNQIGLATGHVREIYHPGYVAKRMEVGAVIGACPKNHVQRISPEPGDVVILLGGKTGRDGIGGATGSSKVHNESSLEKCAAEVQKGNAPEERKLQRLFRNPEASLLIKKANDFGAGGVSVAVGELSDGLEIDLDKLPTKYSGLNATELAISESQERMAVVVSAKNSKKFISLCDHENIEATEIAKVTSENRLVMKYRGKVVVDLDRDFIDTNGAPNKTKALVKKVPDSLYPKKQYTGTVKEQILQNLASLSSCNQKGLAEMFDSTIGASTVLMPYGGKYQDTPTQGAVSLVPVLNGRTSTCTIMTYGFDPVLSSHSPFHGTQAAILESMAKAVAIGADYRKIRFSFQEYFEKLHQDEEKWGKPVASLLGASSILREFSLASIGGKDSMSGSFQELHVPPTLISFAFTTADAKHVISPELKQPGNSLYLCNAVYKRNLPDCKSIRQNFSRIHQMIQDKIIVSAYALEAGGLSDALAKMALGNRLGIDVYTEYNLLNPNYGSIVIETCETIDHPNFLYLGKVTSGSICINNTEFSHKEVSQALGTLESIYPIYGPKTESDLSIAKECHIKTSDSLSKQNAKILLPVFPGTNCDYDTAKAFEEAGGSVQFFIFRNQNKESITESLVTLKTYIDSTDILVLSGGFSAGDEPDGSGKFIANVLRNEQIKAAVQRLLQRRGLILGICNGFQALIKCGLLPFGDYQINENSPTLARNELNRHISKIVATKVISVKSPWMSSFSVGDIHNIPISHGEGKFIVSKEMAKKLFEGGQVAFQYCDTFGAVSNDENVNPNGSDYAIEGILSPDGLILGKMGHSERTGEFLMKNIYGNKQQDIFRNAINYIKKGGREHE